MSLLFLILQNQNVPHNPVLLSRSFGKVGQQIKLAHDLDTLTYALILHKSTPSHEVLLSNCHQDL